MAGCVTHCFIAGTVPSFSRLSQGGRRCLRAAPARVLSWCPNDIDFANHISDQTRYAHWQSVKKPGMGRAVLIGHSKDGIALG